MAQVARLSSRFVKHELDKEMSLVRSYHFQNVTNVINQKTASLGACLKIT